MKNEKQIKIAQKIKAGILSQIRALKDLDRQAGASLTEVLVAVSIIVILMSAIGIAVVGNITKAQITRAKMDIGTISGALQSYYLEKYEYPSEGSWKEALAKYLQTAISTDPWKNEYIYRNPGADNRDFDLISPGRDKTEGTKDDITSWNYQDENAGTDETSD